MPQIMPIRPPDVLKESIKEQAIKRGLTINALVIQILWEWIKAV